MTLRRGAAPAFLLVLWAVGPAAAGKLPDNFTLGRYVPDSFWLLFHTAHNPERAAIDREWGRIWHALEHSGIKNDAKGLVLDLLQPPSKEDRARFEEQWARINELAGAINWSDLAGREMIYAQQIHPLPLHLLLFRGEPGSGQANLPALVALLEHLASLDDALCIRRGNLHGVEIWGMAIPGVPVNLEVFGQGDLIGISTCRSVSSRVVALMTRQPGVRSIIDTPRFRQAMGALPPPEDSVFYGDIRALVGGLKGMFTSPFVTGNDDPEPAIAQQALMRVLDRVDVLDYAATTQQTDGLRELVHSIAVLQADKKDTLLAKALTNRQAFTAPHRFIPVEATSFNVASAIDWGTLYELILDVVGSEIPDGDVFLEKWAKLQASADFDIQRDLFSWLSGELVSFNVPAVAPGPLGGDGVLMLRVKDPELAAQKLEAGLERAKRFFQERVGQMLLVESAPAVKAPGFRIITHPAFFTFLRPVVGVQSDWLIIGTSARAINLHLDTVAGSHESILKNPRFIEEGLVSNQPVCSTSFADMSNFGQQLSGAFLGLGVLGGMIPDDPEARPAKRIVAIIGRLTSVVAQVDFYSSYADTCTFDGRAWRTEAVTRYKPEILTRRSGQ